MRATLALVLVLAIGLSASASAHVIPDPRVLVLVPKPGALEIRVNDMGQPGDDSATTRRQFDGDHDGRLDDAETANLGGFLVVRATDDLKVWQNGKSIPLTELTRAVHGTEKGVESGEAISVDVIVEARGLTPGKDGAYHVSVGDWRPDGHAVRAVALAQDGASITAASLGDRNPDGSVVTGITLDRNVSLDLTWRATPAPKTRAR